MTAPGPTKGMGQQFGDVHVGGTPVAEIDQWDFEPAQKLGGVITNATGGFEGQIRGGISGHGSVRIIVPATGYSAPIVAGASTTLNLYADQAKAHGYTNLVVEFDKAPTKIELNSQNAIAITVNFKSNGPYDAIGAFAILGSYNNEATSSSGT